MIAILLTRKIEREEEEEEEKKILGTAPIDHPTERIIIMIIMF